MKVNPKFVGFFLFSLILIGKTEEILSVHLIAHSHCDPGWLMTDRQYYDRDVRDILNGVFSALKGDPNKRFNWAEISFFDMWWREQDVEKKNEFKEMVKRGQIEFIGGGIAQNDEAATSIDSVINQVTDGHEYIMRNFGTRPRIAWQIDPFGHSTLTPFLFAQMGYEAQIINRINHRLKGDYKANKNMEFLWNPAPSLDRKYEMFTHILYSHYSAPQGFDWESYSWEGGKETIHAGNVDRKSRDLVNELKSRSRSYRTNVLLVAWGDDFKFKNTRAQFDNMDQLVKHINSKPDFGVKIKYSTLSTWFDELKQSAEEQKTQFATRSDEDFFPYADNDQSWWVGYYTSRPVTKVYHRHALSTLRAAEILHLFAKTEASYALESQDGGEETKTGFKKLAEAAWESDIFSHHDGITGTAKAAVMADYLTRLEGAVEKSENVMANAVSNLLKKSGKSPNMKPNPRKLYEFGSNSEKCFPLVASNPLAWPRTEVMDVLVDTPNVHVIVDDKEIVSQTAPVFERDGSGNMKEESELKRFQLFFEVDLLALSSKTYFLCQGRGEKSHESEVLLYGKASGGRNKKKVLDANSGVTLENHFYKIHFDENGFMSKVHTIAKETTEKLHVQYMEYHIGQGGAYIMITWGEPKELDHSKNSLHVFKGPLVQEANTYFNSRNHARLRLFTNGDSIDNKFIETTHVVGTSTVNRELLVRYSSDLKTGKTFYTDNGFKMMPRIRLDRKEERYYPLQTTAFLQDETTSRQLTVLTSSVSGCTMDSDGSLEVILHRSCGQDDGRGLGERMEDGSIVSRKHWLLLESAARTESRRQQMQLKLEHPVRFAHGDLVDSPKDFAQQFATHFSPMGTKSFPQNAHLQTFKARDGESDQVVLRVRHINEGNSTLKFAFSEMFEENTWEVNGASLHGLSLGKWVGRPQLERHPKDVLARINNDVLKVHRVQVGDRQNSDEDGVFLSDDALRLAREAKEKAKKARELLQLDGQDHEEEIQEVAIDPLEIKSYVAVLTASNKHHKSIKIKHGKEVGDLDDDQDDQEKDDQILEPQIKDPLKPPKNEEQKPASDKFFSVKKEKDTWTNKVGGGNLNEPLVIKKDRYAEFDAVMAEEDNSNVSRGEMKQLMSLTLFGVALLGLMFIAVQGRRLKSWFVAPPKAPRVSHRRNY